MLAFLAQFFLKKISRKFCGIEKRHYLCNRNQQNVDSVAQLVEQMTLNHWVESSSLSGVTKQSLKSGCFFYFCRPQAVAYLPARIRAYRVMEECCRSATMDIPMWDGFVNVNQMARATAEGRLYNHSPRLACLPGVSSGRRIYRRRAVV
jgi:hypothetical protein